MIMFLKFLKVIMFFVAAIWGIVLGTLIPISLLMGFDEALYESVVQRVAVIWLITSFIGFVVPCFLVKFKMCKFAAALTLAGATSILYIFFVFPANRWAYMPLLVETVAVVIIAILAHVKEKEKRENAPAESILGGEQNSKNKNGRI